MKLIIKEFLSQLRESGELDRLLPDLLARMKLIPISRPQIGVRQAGVDMAAVGKYDGGVKSLFLFVLKVGDLGRRDWDNDVNSIRPSLNQVRDAYLHSFVRPEHKELPVKVVVCSTGDLKQDITQEFSGYVKDNTTERVSYAFWSGDDLAELIDKHLLDEYAIDPSQRGDLRRAIALIGNRDYDLRHAYTIIQGLLLSGPDSETKLTTSGRKKFIRQMRTVALVLEIVFHWAQEEGNLLNAFKVGERCCLWAWESIRMRNQLKYRPALSAYEDIYRIHARICGAYFEKLRPHFLVQDGLSFMARENALVTDKIFEQIGIFAEIGIVQLQHAMRCRDDQTSIAAVAMRNATNVAVALARLIENNRSSGSPRYDGNAIEISLALLLFLGTGKEQVARKWLEDLAYRICHSFNTSTCFPISSDSFDDLVALEMGDLSEEQVRKLKDLSTLIPTLIYWSVVCGSSDIYRKLREAQAYSLKGICLQLWYPDEDTETLMYRGPAQYESGTTEAPIEFPEDLNELMERERRKFEPRKLVASIEDFSAVRHANFALVMIACRHFRMPFPPQFWMPYFATSLEASDSA